MHGNRPLTLEVLLSYVPLFEGLGQEGLARIARCSQNLRVARNDILFQKGERCEGIHLVVHGKVKLYFTSADGAERVVDMLGQDGTFGEALIFGQEPYMVSAQALSETLLIYVPRTVILEELDASPRLRLRLLAEMSGRLHQVIADSQVFSRESSTQRFIGYLLRHLPEGETSGRDVLLTLPASKGDISSQINVTREHFSRLLHTLSELGLIVVQGRNILIPDVAELRSHRIDAFPKDDRTGGCCACKAAGCGEGATASGSCLAP